MARKDDLTALEAARQSRVICYVTGDRGNMETQIGDDVLPFFAQHLGTIGKVPRLDLLIYSRGGNTLTGFTLANALREFATEVNVLVPFRAHSCATLIALSAEHIVAGPFAQLSPIDPSITTPHGPTIEQGGEKKFLPVSVEDVANYFELARTEMGLKDEANLAGVFGHLTARISPLALGAVYRAREQIGMLATKLLSLHMTDKDKIARIVKTLTRELLSHDYLIGRREAREMGLPVVDASAGDADLMWKLYERMAQELQLQTPWNWEAEANGTQPKTVARGLVESRDLKHVFSSIKRVQAGQGKQTLQISAVDEGWKKA
jgi:hypothetical protein